MINNKTILLLGFTRDDLKKVPPHEGVLYIRHEPGLDDLSPREHYTQCVKMVEKSDAVIVNLSKDLLNLDEMVILHLSYTKSTPVLGVGFKILMEDSMLQEFIAKRFEDLNSAIEHIVVNYQ